MLTASYLTAGFVVLAVGARGYYLANPRHPRGSHAPCWCMAIGFDGCALWRRCSCSSAISMASITLQHQPMKIAAIEGHWDG